MLVHNRANANIEDYLGTTPLHIANQKNNVELAELLITIAHADINKVDEDGKTELHYAVEYGRREMAKLLVKKGAKTTMDKDGNSPLEIASQRSIYD